MKNKSIKSNNGFTLLEVLIAVSIVAFVFTALIKLNISNLITVNRANTLSKLVFLTRQKISEIEMSDFPDSGVESGEFDSYPGYKWETKAGDFGIDGVRKIEISVIAPDGIKNNLIVYKAK